MHHMDPVSLYLKEALRIAATSFVHTLEASQVPVAGEYSMIEMVPSEDAAASTSPSSWGAHAILLIEAVCSVPGVM